MLRLLLICSSVILVSHHASGSPISQIQSDEQITTTDNTVDIYVRDEEGSGSGVTETATEPGATTPPIIIFRQESEEQVEEGEDDSEEEPDEKEPVEVQPSPASEQAASSNSQAPEEAQVNQAEGSANQQESQGNQPEGQVNQPEGQVSTQEEVPVVQPEEGQTQEGQANQSESQSNQAEGQANQPEGPANQPEGPASQQESSPSPQEEVPIVQPDENQQSQQAEEAQVHEIGQISQQEAARPPASLPSAASRPITNLEDPEYAPNVFPEFGETVLAVQEPVSVMSTDTRPVEHVGPKPQKRGPQKKPALKLPIHNPPPFGESPSNFQLSEFEEENEHLAVASSSTPVPVEITTARTTPGKYKISPKTTPIPGIIIPTTVIPPPGASFVEEWNNTNSIFMLSPQGRKECECGKVPFKVDDADKAGINEYPWTIAVVRTGIFGGGRPHCGGTLINDLYVLSAAHCFSGLYPDSLQIWLTAHNSLQSIDNFIPSDRVLKRDVAEILMHPNFDSRNYENDIALIKLTQPVDISTSSYYVPACLPAGVGTYEGMQARITGWGSASSSNSNNRLTPNKMCKNDVPIIGNDVCNRDTSHKNKITSNHMCAGLLVNIPTPTDTCLGDSGGPLMLPNHGRYTVIGITSHGYTHRRAYTPVVYTRVGNYADWILHNTRDAEWCHL